MPTWHEAPDATAVNIVLDPGAAFGTGSHPTTRLVLAWLEREVHGGETVLDYGCGSGILAIAAMKLGAARAVGVDIDPLALEAARYNASANAVALDVRRGGCAARRSPPISPSPTSSPTRCACWHPSSPRTPAPAGDSRSPASSPRRPAR